MRGSYVFLILLSICVLTKGLEEEEAAVSGEFSDAAKLTDTIGKVDDLNGGKIVTTQSHFNVSYIATTPAPPTTSTTTFVNITSDPNYVSTPRPTPTTTTVVTVSTKKVSTTKAHLTKTPQTGEEAALADEEETSNQEEISEATIDRQTKWKNFGMIAVLLAGLSLMIIGCWRFKLEGDSLKESFLEEAATLDMEGDF